MRKSISIFTVVLVYLAVCNAAFAITSSAILSKVKAAEKGIVDIKATMKITEADKKNVSEMGKGYDDILKLKEATIYYKAPDKFRIDGKAGRIKASYIQNGYKRTVIASMIKKTDDLKNDPGKRQNSLDMGFISSRLWTENNVSVVYTDKNITKLKLTPKFGPKDKRHINIWVDTNNLKVTKLEKYLGDGKLRIRNYFSDHKMLNGKLPIATSVKMTAPDGGDLGTVEYKDVEANTKLSDSLFSLAIKK